MNRIMFAGAILFTIVLVVVSGCGPRIVHKVTTEEVLIIDVYNEADGWGEESRTCIQWPDDSRKVIAGRFGKPGDRFMMERHHYVEESR